MTSLIKRKKYLNIFYLNLNGLANSALLNGREQRRSYCFFFPLDKLQSKQLISPWCLQFSLKTLLQNWKLT